MPLIPRSLALVSLLAIPLGGPAVATEPGTPMDCTDLVLAPGLACSQRSDPGEGAFRGNNVVVDDEGRILEHGDGSIRDDLQDLGPCGSDRISLRGLVFEVGDGGRTAIASVRLRCLDPATSTREFLSASSVLFDSVRGTLIVSLNSSCGSRGDLCDGYGGGPWIAEISGFTPLADVLPPPAPRCANGLDDDDDGAIDLDDAQCKSPDDNDESRP